MSIETIPSLAGRAFAAGMPARMLSAMKNRAGATS